MNIAHVVTLLSSDGAFGGPTSVAWQQAESLSRRGHVVTLLAGWDGQADVSKLDVDVRLFKAKRITPRAGFSGLWAPALHSYLMRNSRAFDVIHIHLGRDLITMGSVQIAAARRLPYVVQPHGMIIPDPRRAVSAVDSMATRRALRGAKRIFSLTAEEDRSLLRVAGTPLSLERLRNGIAMDGKALSTRPDLSNRNILFCARLHPRKRVLAFADMAAELRSRGVEATFSVVGPDGGDLDALRERIGRSDLDGTLTYEGSLSPDAVGDRLRNACVFVLPSKDEPFPMTVLEAMAVGTPIVLTDSCHIADELDKRNAVLVTDGSPGGLADAVQQLLSNPQARLAARSHAFDALADTYSIDAVASQLERAYTEAI